jgi:hypothetical protein
MSNLDLFLLTVPYALKGWLAIFIVTLIIVCCISLLNKAGSSKKKQESAE